nr:hypothetical protein [Tanacetum cinerariifolium]
KEEEKREGERERGKEKGKKEERERGGEREKKRVRRREEERIEREKEREMERESEIETIQQKGRESFSQLKFKSTDNDVLEFLIDNCIATALGLLLMVRMTVVFLRLMLRVLAVLVSGLMFLWVLKLFQVSDIKPDSSSLLQIIETSSSLNIALRLLFLDGSWILMIVVITLMIVDAALLIVDAALIPGFLLGKGRQKPSANDTRDHACARINSWNKRMIYLMHSEFLELIIMESLNYYSGASGGWMFCEFEL